MLLHDSGQVRHVNIIIMFRLGEIFEVGIIRRQLWNSGLFPKYTGLWGQVKFTAAQGAEHEASAL